MNISSNLSNFSVEEDSGDHENSSEEGAPEGGVTFGFYLRGRGGSGATLLHVSSESWGRWGERGGLAHPRVGLTLTKSGEGKGESKSTGLGLESLDEVLGSSSSRILEVDWLCCNGSGGGLGSSGVGGVGFVGSGGGSGSVEHSSGGCLRDSTVDITSDVGGTSNGDLLGTSSGLWLGDPLNSGLSNDGSLGGHGTIGGSGDLVDSSKSGSTGNSGAGSGIVGLLGKWIGLNEEVQGPSGLLRSSSGVGFVGGVGGEHSGLGSSGGGSSGGGSSGGGSGLGWDRGWERWRWRSEESTISISDSAVWDSEALGEFTTDVQDDIIISDITDSLSVSKSKSDWLTTVIRSGDVHNLGGSEEPTFDGITVESSGVLVERGSSESASGLSTSSSDSSIAPLSFFISTFFTGNERTVSFLDILKISEDSFLT